MESYKLAHLTYKMLSDYLGSAKVIKNNIQQQFRLICYNNNKQIAVEYCNKRLYLLAQLKRLDLNAMDSVFTPLLPIQSYMHYLFTTDI